MKKLVILGILAIMLLAACQPVGLAPGRPYGYKVIDANNNPVMGYTVFFDTPKNGKETSNRGVVFFTPKEINDAIIATNNEGVWLSPRVTNPGGTAAWSLKPTEDGAGMYIIQIPIKQEVRDAPVLRASPLQIRPGSEIPTVPGIRKAPVQIQQVPRQQIPKQPLIKIDESLKLKPDIVPFCERDGTTLKCSCENDMAINGECSKEMHRPTEFAFYYESVEMPQKTLRVVGAHSSDTPKLWRCFMKHNAVFTHFVPGKNLCNDPKAQDQACAQGAKTASECQIGKQYMEQIEKQFEDCVGTARRMCTAVFNGAFYRGKVHTGLTGESLSIPKSKRLEYKKIDEEGSYQPKRSPQNVPAQSALPKTCEENHCVAGQMFGMSCNEGQGRCDSNCKCN